ncbi:hypothetical protein GCM10027160_09060 [Streptomyces calidiresistens]
MCCAVAVVAAVVGQVSVDELADGAFDAGPGGVEPLASGALPVRTVPGVRFVQVAGEEVHGAGGGAAGAGRPVGARVAPVWVEPGHGMGRHGRWLEPEVAGLAVGAGDLASVEVDGEVVPGEAGLFPALPCSAGLHRADGLDPVVAPGGSSETER